MVLVELLRINRGCQVRGDSPSYSAIQSSTRMYLPPHGPHVCRMSLPPFMTLVKINISTGSINIVKSRRRGSRDDFNSVIYRAECREPRFFPSLHIIERDRS